jgi:hypothetical protein
MLGHQNVAPRRLRLPSTSAINVRDKPISSPGQCLDVLWGIGFVAECFPQFLYGGIEAVLEVDEGVGGPDPFLEFFAGDEFAGIFEQNSEDSDGLGLDLELKPVLIEFSGVNV